MPRIYPIGGGKGGAGKSFITANLGVLLAKQGKRVVLVDLDLGGSNLHTFLDHQDPKIGLNDFLNKTLTNLDHAALPTSIANLSIICSINCSLDIANLFHAQKLKIIKAIQRLPYDYILLDLGAGTHFNTLDFFLTSNEGIFIFTPEPTAIENTLRFIKAVYYRKLKQLFKQRAFSMIVRDLMNKAKDSTIKLPHMIEFVMEQYPDRGKLLEARLSESKFKFILNQFRKQSNPTLGEKIEKVCNRHFYSKFQFLGNVSYDERVYDSIFSKKIYMEKYPYTPTATDMQYISKKLTEVSQDPISVSSKLS
jgi:flagellar biosynthesis protein FlhG